MKDAPRGPLQFQIGFKPIDTEHEIWSDVVTITVVRGPLEAATNTGTVVAGGLFVVWLLWRVRRGALRVAAEELSLGGRAARVSVLTALLLCLIVMAVSSWHWIQYNSPYVSARAVRGSLAVWVPGSERTIHLRAGPAVEGVVYAEDQYESCGFCFWGFAGKSIPPAGGLLIIPLWLPGLVLVWVLYMVGQRMRQVTKGFEVEVAGVGARR